MKKIFITILAAAISLASFSQGASVEKKKDTVEMAAQTPQVPQKTFLLVGGEQTFVILREILLQSKLSLNGQPLSAADALSLIQWVESKKEVPGAEPPKKK